MHYHPHWSAPAILHHCDVLLLLYIQPRDDAAPQVPEESGQAGDSDERKSFPWDDVLDVAVVPGRGHGLQQALRRSRHIRLDLFHP